MPGRYLSVTGGRELRALARDLRGHADRKEINARLRRELRFAAKEMIPPVRAAILAIPSKGQSAARGRPSLRRKMSSATQVAVRTTGGSAGVKLWVNPRRMPPGQGSLPGYMEGEGRWRHPTFGSEPWFTQAPHPYFYRTVAPLIPRAERAAEQVLDSIADEIERG
jgi:hypothetical protein